MALAREEAIQSLINHRGWKYYEEALKHMIDAGVPSISKVKTADEALAVASQVAHVSGIKKALDYAKNSPQRLANLKT